MLNWLSANLATIITAAVLIAVLALVIAVLHRDKKAGRGCCGGDCSQCAHCAGCAPPKQ